MFFPFPPAVKQPHSKMADGVPRRNNGHYAQLPFSLNRPQDMSPDITSRSLCAFPILNLAGLCLLQSDGFLLPEWPFRPCRYRTHVTVDNDSISPASEASFLTIQFN